LKKRSKKLLSMGHGSCNEKFFASFFQKRSASLLCGWALVPQPGDRAYTGRTDEKADRT
jgi:hypothetical protein